MLIATRRDEYFDNQARQMIEQVNQMEAFDVYHCYMDECASKYDIDKNHPYIMPFVIIVDPDEPPQMLEKHPYGVLNPSTELRNFYPR